MLVVMSGAGSLTTRAIRFTDAGADPDDVATVAAIVAAHEVDLLGVVESPAAELEDTLRNPLTDREASVLVLAGDRPVGAVWVSRDPVARQTFFVVNATPDGVRDDVREYAVVHGLAAGKRHAAADGGAGWTVRSGGWIQDVAQFAVLEAHGFTPVRRFHQMLIASDSPAIPAEAPELPPGVELVVGRDEEAYRAGYDVDCAAFADHWNFVVHPYEEWRAELVESTNRDPEGFWLLTVDGVPAAFCLVDDSRRELGEGYVAILGVLREFRGRGLATLLLQRAFVRDRDRGLRGTRLGVDAENTTGAVGVYERVGMHAERTRQGWSLTL